MCRKCRKNRGKRKIHDNKITKKCDNASNKNYNETEKLNYKISWTKIDWFIFGIWWVIISGNIFELYLNSYLILHLFSSNNIWNIADCHCRLRLSAMIPHQLLNGHMKCPVKIEFLVYSRYRKTALIVKPASFTRPVDAKLLYISVECSKLLNLAECFPLRHLVNDWFFILCEL